MARTRDVAVLVGSLRRQSWNRKIADALAAMAPPSLRLSQVEFGALPLYNEDIEGAEAPAAWREFRERIARAEAFLFVTPEYNRSVPGGLKNAIDVASRPYAQSGWKGKPGAVVSVTTGALGAFGANHHLRQSFVFLDIRAMQLPEAYIGRVATLFDETGHISNEGTRELLQRFIDSFADWVEAQYRGR